MDPLTLVVIVVLGSAAAAAAFWPWIVEFFTEELVPWLKESVSPQFGTMVEDLLVWADKGMVPVRSSVKKCYQAFRENVLGANVTFEKETATTGTKTTEAFIRNSDGKVMKRVFTEEVEYDDLPEAIREEMHRQHKKKANLDIKAVIDKKVRDRAVEEGMVLEA